MTTSDASRSVPYCSAHAAAAAAYVAEAFLILVGDH